MISMIRGRRPLAEISAARSPPLRQMRPEGRMWVSGVRGSEGWVYGLPGRCGGRAGPGPEVFEGGDGAGDGEVEFPVLDLFCAAVLGGDIGQADGLGDGLYYLDLFADAVYEVEAGIGEEDGQGDAGEAAAGADIDDVHARVNSNAAAMARECRICFSYRLSISLREMTLIFAFHSVYKSCRAASCCNCAGEKSAKYCRTISRPAGVFSICRRKDHIIREHPDVEQPPPGEEVFFAEPAHGPL
jgi:hypothetical protein